jgi:hypothetical protein
MADLDLTHSGRVGIDRSAVDAVRPDDPVAASCRDDRARCRRATDAVAARCACPK